MKPRFAPLAPKKMTDTLKRREVCPGGATRDRIGILLGVQLRRLVGSVLIVMF